MRILVVEDDARTARAVSDGLYAAGHACVEAPSAEGARIALNTSTFDLAIVDIGLPGADGLSLLRHLRKSGSGLPVLILTGRDGVRDRVGALDMGADDYLPKPFAMAELLARCRALWRRAQHAAGNSMMIGHLRLDFTQRRANRGEQPLSLTRSEWQVLECLAARPGRIVTKDALGAALAQGSEEATAHAVETCLSRLRAKLDGSARITALRGLGYRLDEQG